MSSIRKLAALAGVSPMTVFRALHGTGRISPETRRQILELAALYEYNPAPSPSESAGKQRLVGCLVSQLDTPFNALLLKGISTVTFEHSYHLTVLETHSNVLHTQKALQAYEELGVCGIIALTGHYEQVPTQSLFELRSRQIPFITVDASSPTALSVDRVLTDEDQLALMGINFLLAQGHQRIAYWGPNIANYPRGRSYAVQQVMKQRKLSLEYFLDSTPVPWMSFRHDQTCIESLRRLLSSPKPPTALFAFSDEKAAFVIKQAARLGLRVPQDLSVLGCANFPISEDLTPSLTTFEQFPEEIGRRAAQLLVRRLNECDQQGEFTPETIKIAPKLIIRESCAPPKLG